MCGQPAAHPGAAGTVSDTAQRRGLSTRGRWASSGLQLSGVLCLKWHLPGHDHQSSHGCPWQGYKSPFLPPIKLDKRENKKWHPLFSLDDLITLTSRRCRACSPVVLFINHCVSKQLPQKTGTEAAFPSECVRAWGTGLAFVCIISFVPHSTTLRSIALFLF